MVKLGDLGVSVQKDFSEDMTESKAGTLPYMSPEIVKGDEYSKQTDMWSLGVVLYQLMTLRLPFDGENISQISK